MIPYFTGGSGWGGVVGEGDGTRLRGSNQGRDRLSMEETFLSASKA